MEILIGFGKDVPTIYCITLQVGVRLHIYFVEGVGKLKHARYFAGLDLRTVLTKT